jgi:hypothetical protein
MSTKSRQAVYGGAIMDAQIRAEGAREAAKKAIREADRAEAEAWSILWKAMGGPGPSRDRRSHNASTAGSAGLRSSVTGVRPAPAYRSMRSAGRGIHRFGSLKQR